MSGKYMSFPEGIICRSSHKRRQKGQNYLVQISLTMESSLGHSWKIWSHRTCSVWNHKWETWREETPSLLKKKTTIKTENKKQRDEKGNNRDDWRQLMNLKRKEWVGSIYCVFCGCSRHQIESIFQDLIILNS